MRQIQAKAFTTGQDVFFRQGAYEPGSRGGQKLIAHELTHVVQQKGVGIRTEKKENRDKASVPETVGRKVEKYEYDGSTAPYGDVERKEEEIVVQGMFLKVPNTGSEEDFGEENTNAFNDYVGEKAEEFENVDLSKIGECEDLYIWAHMGAGIGDYTPESLVREMLRKGFRGCGQIVLLGCNPDDKYDLPSDLGQEFYKQRRYLKTLVIDLERGNGKINTGGTNEQVEQGSREQGKWKKSQLKVIKTWKYIKWHLMLP